ncbi:UNVERIFIED_CONTAM: DnaA/Hda family protein [Campylobacter lari]
MNINELNKSNKNTYKVYTEDFLKGINTEINDKMIFKNFFANMEIIDVDYNNVVSIVTNISKTSLDLVKHMYNSHIIKTLNDVFDRECTYLFVLKENSSKKIITTKNQKEIKPTKKIEISTDINQDFTFNNYVKCDFNAEAVRFANMIINGENSFNPVFIYGSSGLGKTHLLHAISHELISKNVSVKYVNSNTFSRDIQFVLQENDIKKIKEIRDEFDNADVVMFDDFQSYGIGNKKATLNLIFNILDYRISFKKVTLICSDRPIDSLSNMFDDRLITRLSMGLQLEIKQPAHTDLLKILDFIIKENNLSPQL